MYKQTQRGFDTNYQNTTVCVTKCRSFQFRAPRSKQNNHRGLDCMEIACMYCFSSSCRKGFVSLCLQLFCICTTATEGFCYQNETQERKSPRALEQLVELTPHLNQQVAAHQILSQPQSTVSALRSCSKRAQMLRGSTFLNQYVVRSQDHTAIGFEMPQAHWDAESHSGVEWSQFSSASPLGAFLTSLKGAQVISCHRLNPFHLLQLYWQLPQQKQGHFGRIKCPAFLDVLQAFWRLREQELLNHTSRICYQEIHSVQSWVCWLKCSAG